MKLGNAQAHGIFPNDIRETLAHVLNLLRDTFSSLAMGSWCCAFLLPSVRNVPLWSSRMESAFDKQMPGILKVMNSGFDNNRIFHLSSDLCRHENKVIWIFILFILVMFITLKSNGKFYGNFVWLEMVLPSTEKDLNVWNRSVFTKFSSPLSWTLWNLFSCVTRCVACVFFTMRGFWIASENHVMYKKIYPFDLCFLVPTTHVILIIGVPSCNLFHLCESTHFPILNKITTNFF